MSKSSEIYEEIVNTIEGAYPEKKELANPYDVDDNADAFLDNGFGIILGPASSDEIVSPVLRQTRAFGILLTKKIFATDNSISARKTVEKEILDEGLNIIQQLKLNDDLRQLISSVHLTGDDGIALSGDDRQSYLYTTFTIDVYYNEQLTNF